VLHKEIDRLQSKVKHSNGLHQETQQLRTEKNKEAVDRAQEQASLTEERNKLLAKVEKLGRELTRKDDVLAKASKSLKQDVAQSYLVGFEATIKQALALHPDLDFSDLGPGKTMVDGQLRDD